jgi:hypothetical protein
MIDADDYQKDKRLLNWVAPLKFGGLNIIFFGESEITVTVGQGLENGPPWQYTSNGFLRGLNESRSVLLDLNA